MRICSFTDYLLLKVIQRRIGAKTIRSKSNINWQHKKKNEIREKNKSVASALSVIDFEHGEGAEGERAQ